MLPASASCLASGVATPPRGSSQRLTAPTGVHHGVGRLSGGWDRPRPWGSASVSALVCVSICTSPPVKEGGSLSEPGPWVCPWQSSRGGCVWSPCGAGHHMSPCLCTWVRESLSEPEREGAEGIALSSQTQGRPCWGVAQRRGRVSPCPAGHEWLTVSGCSQRSGCSS